MTQQPSPEARFLALAAMPGMETLRRECQHLKVSGLQTSGTYYQDTWGLDDCPLCQKPEGWLPLPEPERLGALVRVVLILPDGIVEISEFQGEIAAMVYLGASRKSAHKFGDNPEAAVTEALLASLGIEAQEAVREAR